MKIYGLVARGPLLNLEGKSTITSRRMFRKPPTEEQKAAFRATLVSSEGSGACALSDLDPEASTIAVTEFELED